MRAHPVTRRTPGTRISTLCGHIIYWTAIIGTIWLSTGHHGP